MFQFHSGLIFYGFILYVVINGIALLSLKTLSFRFFIYVVFLNVIKTP